MAKIETVDFYRWKEMQTNVSYKVGIGEQNERNDVLLIQTLFKLIGFSDIAAKKRFGVAMKDLPETNGIYDEKMTRAIWGFQQKMLHRLRRIDGKIHPASYANRVLKKGANAPQMMITLLNFMAFDEAIMANYDDLITAVKKISPSIIFVP